VCLVVFYICEAPWSALIVLSVLYK